MIRELEGPSGALQDDIDDGIFSSSSSAFDADAQAFFTAASISDATQKSAVNTLVLALKAATIWTKMHAIYPVVGGTAAKHKWNLKNPLDTDAAFRLTFTGAWVHSATGMLPDAGTAFADTHYIMTTHGVNNDTHASFYSRTSSSSGYDIGAETATGMVHLSAGLVAVGGNYLSDMYNHTGTNRINNAVANSLGLFTDSRTDASTHKAFRNATQIGATDVSASSEFAGVTIALYFGALNNAGTPVTWSNRECAWYSIGLGLTAADVTALNAAVQAFQTTMTRNV